MWVSAVLLVGLLGRLQVTTGGLAFPFRRESVTGDITEALLDREFVDFGGAFVGGGGLVMAIQVALMGLPVPLVRALGAFGGAPDVFLRDALPGRQFRPPALQFPGALGGLLTWRNGHEPTLRRLRSISGAS